MNSSKKSLILLLIVFITPVILGTLLFFNLEKLGFEKGSTNYGTLIQPARPAVMVDLMQADQAAVKEDTLAKRWTLTYLAPKNCDQTCLDKLTLIKKVRLLTNEKMRRVRTLLVTNKVIADSLDKKQYPDMVVTYTGSADSEFLQQFPAQETNPIYLIDPLGNIMMYYPQEDTNAKKMIKDLSRLLKYSKLG